ncbi:MAG: hypothetical protein LH618_04770, partial [Saprospiraceae bacterium]|nr:hypothetical protein [Saprospiraceae bacterium]
MYEIKTAFPIKCFSDHITRIGTGSKYLFIHSSSLSHHQHIPLIHPHHPIAEKNFGYPDKH